MEEVAGLVVCLFFICIRLFFLFCDKDDILSANKRKMVEADSFTALNCQLLPLFYLQGEGEKRGKGEGKRRGHFAKLA